MDLNMLESIARKIREQAKHIEAVHERFQIVPRPAGAYPERAISFYFIRALASAVDEGGHVVLEAGIANEARTRNECHIDALVFGSKDAILAEFKRAWTPRHWSDLACDVVRVRRCAADIRERFERRQSPERPAPTRFFGFYGCDCWRAEVAAAWKNGDGFKRWSIPDVFREMHRDVAPVWSVDGGQQPGTDFDGYYLLWAVEELQVVDAPPIDSNSVAPARLETPG